MVGEDIPAGTYSLHCIYNGDAWGNYAIFGKYSDGEWQDRIDYDVVYNDNTDSGSNEKTWVIRLEPGNGLHVSDPMDITIFKGVIFE